MHGRQPADRPEALEYCNPLRDDGLSYRDYVEQLTYLLFLKMAHERTQLPLEKASPVPKGRLAESSTLSSSNTYKNGAWISGSGGEFRFEDMPAADYSVEAIFPAESLEESTKPPPPGVGESGQRAATPASPPRDEEPANGVEDLAWVRPPRVNEFGEWITTELEPTE